MSLNFLRPIGDFKYSINLEFDLQNDEKVKSFIPTSGSLSIIKEILYSTMSNENAIRARLLTGSYGKGKSHLTLTLLALLSGRDKKLFNNLLIKCKKTDIDLYNNIKMYIESGNKLLPVIINTSSNSLKTNFLNSLDIALKQNGMEKLMPDTFYDAAISTIKNWESNYHETFKSMEKLMGDAGKSIINKLGHYNQSIYDMFVQIYPMLTAGSVFNPMVGADTVKLYQIVIQNIKKYGYNGIFVVYDEFGKFLEGSSDLKSTADDLKLLQDMAELSERTQRNGQFNLLLISHKGIDNYVSNLSKERIDNWKAIAGRFYRMSMQSQDDEIYDIIATALNKDKKGFDLFAEKHEREFDILKQKFDLKQTNTISFKTGAFKEVINSVGLEFIKKCYPLHPYTLLMLPKISELVAQNERSIFTYLSSNEKNSVSYYAKRTYEEFPIIEPDAIYDYFESLFKGEPYGSHIREQWEIAAAAVAKLSSCENELAIKLIKTISLIYIIDEFEILPPSLDLIEDIYSLYGDSEIIVAFEILRKEELLIELEFKPYVKIRRSSKNNIKELIDNEIASIKTVNAKNILMEIMNLRYFYPVDYNDEQEIIRYFKFMFLNMRELAAISDMTAFMDNVDADGAVIALLINDSSEIDEAISLTKKLNNVRVVYIVPKEIKNIDQFLRKYQAVSSLIEKKSNDSLLVEELEYIRNDLRELIEDYVLNYYIKPESGKMQFIYMGDVQKIRRRKNLSTLLSEICSKIFYRTPKIINESINRNSLSATMKITRKKILDGVLVDNLKPNLNLLGSQSINVVRSVYVVTGLINDLDNPAINYENCCGEIKNVLNEIEDFLTCSSDCRQNFGKLYDVLVKPQYGYGLKSGIIPFLIVIVIRKFKKRLVIYNKNKELEITSDLILSINQNPYLYEAKIENLGKDEEQYLKRLDSCFSQYGLLSDMEFSRFDYIVKAMQRWYFQLTKYDRETQYYVDEKTMKFLKLSNAQIRFKNNLGNPEINPREFLFDEIKKISNSDSYIDIGSFVITTKKIIDGNMNNVINRFKTILCNKLDAPIGSSLYSAMQDFYDGLKETTKNHVFYSNASYFIDTIKSANNDDDRTVKLLLKNLFSLRINDFTDELMMNAEEVIADIINSIRDYDLQINIKPNRASSFILKLVDKNGSSEEMCFDELNKMNYQSNMFYNEIMSAVDDFSESLTASEKSQIMLKIIKELSQ